MYVYVYTYIHTYIHIEREIYILPTKIGPCPCPERPGSEFLEGALR